MSDCLFCKIATKQIPSSFLFEDDDVCAFRDIAPQAPVHILVIPKRHFSTVNEVTDFAIIGKMASVLKDLAHKEGIDQRGYRLVMNCNPEGGQSVYHIHMHLLGGTQLGGGMTGL